MGENFITYVTAGIALLILILYKLIKPVVMEENVDNGERLFISANDVYEQVKLSIASGNHSVAQKLAKKYLKENPHHDRLRYILAKSFYETGDWIDAIEQLEHIKTIQRNRSEVLTMLADVYKKTGQYSNSIDAYLELLDENPDSIPVLVSLAELYNSVNHKKSALNIYKRILNFDIREQEKITYYYQVANIYKEIGEYDNAIEYVIFGLNVDTNNIKLLYLYRELCSLTENLSKEIDIMNKLLILAPTDAYLQFDLVNLYYKAEMYDEALDIAIPSLNTPNADVEGLNNVIANIYLRKNKLKEGVGVLERAMEMYPDSIRLTESLANAYKLNGEYEKSIQLYEKLVEWADIKLAKVYNIQLSSVYCDWALYLFQRGNSELCFEKFDMALQLNPDNPYIYEGLGHVNYFAKNYTDAIRQLQKAINIDPNNVNNYIFLADIYLELDNVFDAERTYKEAVYVDEKNPVCRAKLGIIKLKQRELGKARENLEFAVKLEPNNWNYIYNLALVYEMSGENTRAVDMYNKVLALNPSHDDALKNLKMLKNIR